MPASFMLDLRIGGDNDDDDDDYDDYDDCNAMMMIMSANYARS